VRTAALVLFLAAGTAKLSAQTPALRQSPRRDPLPDALPNAPGFDLLAQNSAAIPAVPQATHPVTARIKGVVSDIQGGLVPGAHLTAVNKDTHTQYRTTADSVGFFTFTNLPSGTYAVTITSPGLQTYVLDNIHLKPGEIYSLPGVSLPIARTAVDVEVTLTEQQLATVELHAELQQRVFGVLPNFYTSYQWNAAPLTSLQKLKLTARAAGDPTSFATTAVIAGFEQRNNTFPEYGGGAAGYWRRYGAAYGDAVIGRALGSVVFASLFRQDPRYFVMTNGSIKRRAWHAISSTFIARGDNKRWQPAYAHLVGNATAGLVASTYHPDSSPGTLVLDNTLLGLGGEAVNNLVREFFLRRISTHTPSYAKGKPPKY
jgi:hypothetical protein